ncbi:MAG: hypothetical protein KAR40_09750 [Candidatus Sabulitectum sp.]|nr:hypothetical protein [Candidatus Sabulitectum sp.]
MTCGLELETYEGFCVCDNAYYIRKVCPDHDLMLVKEKQGHVVMTKLNDDDTIGSKTVKELVDEVKVPR